MGEREVRSAWSSTPGDHPRWNETASSHGAPYVDRRADQGGGHIAGHVGKAASSPMSLKRPDQAAPVIGVAPGVIDEERFLGPER